MSEASTRKMSCASLNNLAAFELAVLTNQSNRRNGFINATYNRVKLRIGSGGMLDYTYNKEPPK